MSTENAPSNPNPPSPLRGRGAGGEGKTVAEKKRPFRLRFHSWIRWIHTYLSMLTFAIVGFFSLTGVLLNHPDWTFGIAPKTIETKGTLDKSLLAKPDWIAIEAHLRKKDGVQGIAGEDQADDREASLRFSGPAYTADVVIEKATGDYTVKTERQGIVALLGDLHRGKDTARPWSWAIDASGYFLTLISLTGLGMVFFLKKVKAKALITVGAGIVLMLILMKLASG